MAVESDVSRYEISHLKSLKLDSFILGIAEKPDAAKNIAMALDPKSKEINFKVEKLDQQTKEKITLPKLEKVYQSKYKGKTMIIVPASGHLFTLIQDGYGWQFPVYDFKWVPLNESYKNSKKININYLQRIEATIEIMRYLTNLTEDRIVMTDYDEEGEVIGAVILSELSGEKSLQMAKRMRYSSFAKKEIQTSFDKTVGNNGTDSGIDFGMYLRGLMRHYLDWLWGINLSRALMLSLKNTTGRYFTLSTGRVQGPTLSFVADREEKINLHVPVPKFKINLSIKAKSVYDLIYREGEFKVEKDGKKIVSEIEGNQINVADVSKKENDVNPPAPYNLSTLQKDGNRFFGFEPSRTLRAAQKLYLAGVTSYPRTSSEKYPPETDHKAILRNLAKIPIFKSTSNKVISKSKRLNRPNEGSKKDPAHPCLHPTGELPKKLGDDDLKIFSLITYRYFATFGKPAVVENTQVLFEVSNHNFRLSGKRTIDKGWREWAGAYDSSKDVELPNFKVGAEYKINNLLLETKYSNPPAKFTQSSLLTKMEKVSIGTKATRADIIKNLVDRKFLRNKPLDITLMGDTITEVLKNYSPQVISVELSRKLEEMGDLIQQSVYENKPESEAFTLSDALVRGITLLHEMLDQLMFNQKQIGELIDLNLLSQRRDEAIIGDCMNCDDGKLKMIRSLASGKRFVGCSNYFTEVKCNTTYPLPQREKLDLKTANCPADNYPTLRVFPIYNPKKKKQGRPWILCLNPECPKRKERQEEIEKSKMRAKERKLKKTTKKTTKKVPKKATKKTTKRTTKKTKKRRAKK